MDNPSITDSPVTCLTIAGSDPTSGAGIQADLRVFHDCGVHGTSVVAAVTVQNTLGVFDLYPIPESIVRAQLERLVVDLCPRAAKCGALGTVATVEMLAEFFQSKPFPLVIDPVLSSSNGSPLLSGTGVREAMSRLIGVSTLVTPNLAEAEFFAEHPVTDLASMESAAKKIASVGGPSVLIKGGHLPGDAVDLLWDEGRVHLLRGARITTDSVHGTGCMLSAAITARIGNGDSILQAVQFSKEYLTEAIRNRVLLGHGSAVLI